MFEISLVTSEYTFYSNFEECDENGNTQMYDNKGNLISNNYFAYTGLMEELEKVYKGELIPNYIHDDLSNYLEEYFN